MTELLQAPNSPEAECAVLGGLMHDPSALSKIADWIVADDFFQSRHRLIFAAITDLVSKGQPCDSVTLAEHFHANGTADLVGAWYPMELQNGTAGAAAIVAHAEIVVERSRLRKAIDAGTTLASAAYAPGADSGLLVASTLHALSQMQTTRLRGGLVSAKGPLKAMQAECARRYEQGPGLLGLPTPWKDVNTATKGLRKGSLYILGARPSMGKSIFALNVAAFNALRGKRVAFFSVEMTAEECMARSVAAHGRIPFEWVEQPNNADMESELYWGRHTNIITDLMGSGLLIDETPGLRSHQLVARAKRAHVQAPLDLIVVDHMHDMGTDPKGELRTEYGLIAQDAKSLAKELQVPVLLAAQLNRGSATRADRRPMLVDLRESGEIEQKADVVLFLHREDYYDQGDKRTHLQGVVEVIVAKGRNIRRGETIHLRNRFDEMRLDDWEGALPQAPLADDLRSNRGFRRVA